MKRIDRRCGFTMQEMAVAISVSAALLVITVGWLHHSMKFASLMNQRQRHHQSLTRLAWELRNDVQNSTSFAMDGDKRLQLEWDNGTLITYTISNALSVVEKQRTEPDDDSTLIRDTFALSRNSKASWQTSDMPDWISLIVARGPEGVPSSMPSQRSDNSQSPSNAENLTPVDLYVRVGRNRWPPGLTEVVSPKTYNREPK